MRIEIGPTPVEGVECSIGLGRVGRDVSVEEVKGVSLLAGGMRSEVLQSERNGLGGCVESGTTRMGSKGL